MSRFRDFLYLDEPAIDRFISGVEGGLYDEAEESWKQSSGAVDPGGVESSGDGPGVESTQASTSEVRRTLRQNAEARFSRLWKAIEDDPDERPLSWPADEKNFWEEATDERFCKIVGALSVPPMIAMIASSAEILQFGRLAQQFGAVDANDSTLQQIETMSTMKEMIKDRMPVLLAMSSDQVPVALPLETAHSRVGPDRYVGRAVVYGRVVERIPRGSAFTLLNVPGAMHLPMPNRKSRRQGGGKKGSDENELRGPAVVLRAIAITQ